MDAFWELSDFDVQTREKGFENLCQSLKSPTNGTTVDYALNRLVKGLVSNRKCARLGFASALGTLARRTDTQEISVPSTDELLTTIQTKLTTKKETGVEDAKNVRIGRVLGYVALAHAEKDVQSSKIITKILPDLLVIRQQETRRRLRAFIDATIVQLAKWTDRKTMKKEIFPQIENLFPTDWSNAVEGSKSIYLFVALANSFPKVFDEKFVLSLGKTVEEQNTIKTTLQTFDNEIHFLDQLCRELFVYSVRTGQLTSFWPVLINELSNNGFDSNKGQILLNLIIFALEENKTFDVFQLIETIVEQSEKIFAEIFDFLSSAGRKSYQQTSIDLIKKMIEKLGEVLAKKPLEFRLKIFEKLLKSADKNYAGLQPIGKSLVKELKIDEISMFVEKLFELFCLEAKEDESALDRRRHFLLETISFLCECSTFDLKNEICATNFQTIVSIVSLLAFFKLKENYVPKEFRQFLKENVEISDATREHLEDLIYKFLMFEFHHNGFEQSLAVFRQTMIWTETPKKFTPLFKKFDEIRSFFQDENENLSNVVQGETINALPDEKLRLAFRQVFLLGFFDIFDDFQRAKQYFEDLTTCLTNAQDELKSKTKKIQNESSWIEVFIDILLSMYTKKQHEVRTMIKKIYQHIVPHLTENALKLMLQTIAPEEEEDDDDEDEDEDEDEDDEDEEDEDEEEEDEELMETSAVNEELRQAVEKALGDAAIKENGNNDDDDNDVDMDDEAMLRLDPMIAEAFRSQLKKSSNIKLINEKLHHQFRVLDLIESVIKKDERMRFVLLSIRPLIETLISLPNTPAYKSMNERLDSILQHLSSRKIDHSDLPTTDECLELFRYLTSLAGTRTKLNVETLAKVSMFVIKLSLHVGKVEDRLAGVEELILTKYESGFLRFLSPNDSKKKEKEEKENGEEEEEEEPMPRQSVVNPIIMKEFLSRFPEYRSRSMLLMVQTALKDTINWKKRNIVCGTLNKFFNKKQLENVDKNLLESTINLLVKMCHESKASKIESLHVITALTQKLLLIRNPKLSNDQATTLFDSISLPIKAKPIHSDKQRKQLLNLIQSFRKRFEIKIDDDLLNLLTKKKKN